METNLLILLGPGFHSLSPAMQEQLYKQFFNFLYGPIMYLLRDHGAVEDIIQETFLTTLRKPPIGVTDELHFKSWIKVVAKNNVMNVLRKQKRSRGDVSLENVLAHDAPIAAAMESVERQVELNSLKEEITLHMKDMRADHRTILELKWKRGLSYKEIADEIDESEDAVRQKLHRARINLKKKMKHNWGEPR